MPESRPPVLVSPGCGSVMCSAPPLTQPSSHTIKPTPTSNDVFTVAENVPCFTTNVELFFLFCIDGDCIDCGQNLPSR